MIIAVYLYKLAISMYNTSSELQSQLGDSITRLRLQKGVSQTEVAARANIAVTSIVRLEAGKGGNLATFIKVLKALDSASWLNTLAPLITVSPMDIVNRLSERQRVYAPRRKKTPSDNG